MGARALEGDVEHRAAGLGGVALSPLVFPHDPADLELARGRVAEEGGDVADDAARSDAGVQARLVGQLDGEPEGWIRLLEPRLPAAAASRCRFDASRSRRRLEHVLDHVWAALDVGVVILGVFFMSTSRSVRTGSVILSGASRGRAAGMRASRRLARSAVRGSATGEDTAAASPRRGRRAPRRPRTPSRCPLALARQLAGAHRGRVQEHADEVPQRPLGLLGRVAARARPLDLGVEQVEDVRAQRDDGRGERLGLGAGRRGTRRRPLPRARARRSGGQLFERGVQADGLEVEQLDAGDRRDGGSTLRGRPRSITRRRRSRPRAVARRARAGLR